nr:GSTS1h [Helicoverpa armigera]
MPKKLQYFDLNGLAEPLRYLLHYTKQEFEDYRHDIATWPDPKIKESLPFGQFPVYEEDGRVLCQTLAIAKYVARGTDLIPSDPWENALAEQAVYSITDYHKNVIACIQEQDREKKSEMKNKLINETIEYYFSRLNKLLNENGGYFSGKLSWVEFVLCGTIEASNLFFSLQIEKDYPAIKAVMEEITSAPGVKEYIEARGPYNLDGIRKRFGDI